MRTHLTREEFERLARPVLDQTVAVTKRLIADAGLTPADDAGAPSEAGTGPGARPGRRGTTATRAARRPGIPATVHATRNRSPTSRSRSLVRLGDGPEPVQVTAAGVRVDPGRPYRIGVVVIGDQIRLYVDGEHVKATTDSRVGRGYYGLGGFAYPADFTVIYFSDFRLWSA